MQLIENVVSNFRRLLLKMNELLEKTYYDPTGTGSYSGVNPLLLQVNQLLNSVVKKRQVVTEWLSGEDTYTLHRPARRNFARNKTLSKHIDYMWQADLVDMQSLSRKNGGIKYLLVIIDSFSRFAWVHPLKNKSGKELVEAFRHVFITSGRKPLKLCTDMGTEFTNHQVQQLLKENEVFFYTTASDKKAAMVERLNRTLKEKIWRYFTHHNTHRYIDVLQDFVNAYNNSRHRIIGMAPAKVTKKDEKRLWQKQFGHLEDSEEQTTKFNVGDQVRVSTVKNPFEKGYWGNWSEEVFRIKDIRKNHAIPMFIVEDSTGEVLKGAFYAEQLQKVIERQEKLYSVEKVVARKKIGGVPHVLVKWQGYPKSANSWIAATELKKQHHG